MECLVQNIGDPEVGRGMKVVEEILTKVSTEKKDERLMGSYLVKVRSTPFGGVLSSMAVEHGEEALTTYRVKIYDERVGILHCSSSALVL
jgi:hypothetical protein